MCLINAALEHFVTQTSKKLETALKTFMEPRDRGSEGPRADIWGQGSRAEKNKYLNLMCSYLKNRKQKTQINNNFG